MRITTNSGAPWSADATTAHKILTVSDRTPKERRAMAELYAVKYQNLGRTKLDPAIAAFTYHDGSQIMIIYDEDLCPTEMIEV